MKKIILGFVVSIGCIASVDAGSLPWVAEHLSTQHAIENTLATFSVFSILAISSQSWKIYLDHQTIQYDSPIEDFVEINEFWKSSTGVEWQYHSSIPESDYFEMESLKAMKSFQYLQFLGGVKGVNSL